MKLRAKFILLALVPLFFTTIIICIFTYPRVNSVIKQLMEHDLKAVASLQRDNITLEPNYYHLDENGDLWNGDSIDISQEFEALDEIRAFSGIDVTVFYGDTRYMTTVVHNGERVLGTKASEAVIQKVLIDGEEFFSENVDVAGEKYFAYYIPYYNDGESAPVGMIFAGKSQEVVESEVFKIIGVILLIALFALICCTVVVLLVASRITTSLKRGINTLTEVSQGNLTAGIDPAVLKSKDETGEMAKAINTLRDTLLKIVGSIAHKSDQVFESASVLGKEAMETSSAVSNVESAVLEIAEGASSQASDTQSATNDVIRMGEMVEETNQNVGLLEANAAAMEKSGIHAQDTLHELEAINAQAKQSIDVIYEQTNTTNVSAQRIREAINLITSIAEETNLLSLNASIEAARAGEQGRGFAVVASQIQKLAEQSNDSAHKIDEIIASLMQDSENAVSTMEDVKSIMQQQSNIVERTSQSFSEVMDGIENSKKSIVSISESTKQLDASRASVISLVSNLSAIAEENAAMTQETSSSTSQVTATIQEMSANATHLQSISEELKDSVKIFRM